MTDAGRPARLHEGAPERELWESAGVGWKIPEQKQQFLTRLAASTAALAAVDDGRRRGNREYAGAEQKVAERKE